MKYLPISLSLALVLCVASTPPFSAQSAMAAEPAPSTESRRRATQGSGSTRRSRPNSRRRSPPTPREPDEPPAQSKPTDDHPILNATYFQAGIDAIAVGSEFGSRPIAPGAGFFIATGAHAEKFGLVGELVVGGANVGGHVGPVTLIGGYADLRYVHGTRGHRASILTLGATMRGFQPDPDQDFINGYGARIGYELNFIGLVGVRANYTLVGLVQDRARTGVAHSLDAGIFVSLPWSGGLL